jgi:hypothetical protein
MDSGFCHWRGKPTARLSADEKFALLAGMARLFRARRNLSRRRLTMCTVSLIVRKSGYTLGMNRDEQLTRAPGLPPSKKTINGSIVLSPSEPGGGTWIALNDSGVTFALINWYSVTRRAKGEIVSRGQVVESASGAKTPGLADAALTQLQLKRINPFRLIGIFPVTGEIVEWRWDLKGLVHKKHRWNNRQWISSGFDEPAAQRVRSRTFREALKQKSAGSFGWLRRLHRSHSPQAGPFSTCMHRTDAATVSYTEVNITPTTTSMSYQAGPPCKGAARVTLRHTVARKVLLCPR